MTSHDDDAFTTFAQDDEEDDVEDDRQKKEKKKEKEKEGTSSNKTTPNQSQQHEDDPYQSFIQEMKSLLVTSCSSSPSSSYCNQWNNHASLAQSSSNTTLWRSETLPRSDVEDNSSNAIDTSTILNTTQAAVDEHTNNDNDDVNEEELERMASEWTEYWDDKLKRPYFHHHPTGTVQWRPPTHWHNLALSKK
jgi:hypothetical protein